jgi:alpha-L-fucosidase
MRESTIGSVVFLLSGIWAAELCEAQIEPTWESMAANYQVPEWFVDGKIGVWMHWGIPSAADENRPNDGSHYGRRMYSPPPEGKPDKDLSMNETLTKWHIEHYGPIEEFGYEGSNPAIQSREMGSRRPGPILQGVRCPLHHAGGLPSR